MRILRLALSVSVLFVACGSDGSSTKSHGDGGTDNGAVPSCAEICPGVVAAHCPNGPVDQADCESGCATIQSNCASEYANLYGCAGSKPTYKCGSAIGVIVNGCEAQSSALESCLTAP